MRRKLFLSKVSWCLLLLIALATFSCATAPPLSPVVIRERNPRLSANYSLQAGKESTNLSINTQIKVLETYSLKTYEAIKRGEKNIDLRGLRPGDLGSAPYYLLVASIKGTDMTVYTGKGTIRNGITGILATQKKIYVVLNIPREQAIICRVNALDNARSADSSIKVETMDGTYAKVWGSVFFEVGISSDSWESMKGSIMPVLSNKEISDIILRSMTGK